jgi:hypothetical protein
MIKIKELNFIIIVFVSFYIFVLGANPFKGETVAPVQLLEPYAGWSTHKFESKKTHRERSDVLDALLPQWIEIKKQIKNRDSILWNPTASGGTPAFFNLTSGTLTPSFLFFIAFDSNSLGFYFAGLAKLVLGSLGTYLLLRIFLGPYAAIFGSICFSLSGFNTAWFYWQHTSTSIWIPWLLWATICWYKTANFKWLLVLIPIACLLIMGGFPSVAAYGFYSVILLIPFLILSNQFSIKKLIFINFFFGISILISFLIVAVPLLHMVEFLSTFDLSYRKGGTVFKSLKDLFLLIKISGVERNLFIGFIAIIFSAISLSIFFDKKYKKEFYFIGYLIVLFLLSIIVAFGLLSYEAISYLPGIRNSVWSRIIVLSHLSISILAAISLNYLLKKTNNLSKNNYRYIIFLFLYFSTSYQVYQQINQFRHFNTVAKSKDFFPSTNNTEYLKKNLSTFQSVVADKSYFVSGTLGAYGIPEWLSHGFKSNSEKQIFSYLIDKPFKSPTAAIFSSSQIKFDALLYAKLGIKFILVDNPYQNIENQPLGGHKVLPPLPENNIKQSIYFDNTLSFDAIGFILATYHQDRAPSNVILNIYNSKNTIIAQTKVEADKVKDNKETIFIFNDTIKLESGRYQFELLLENPIKSSNKLTAYYVEKISNKGNYIILNGKKQEGNLNYSIKKKITKLDGWKEIKFPLEKTSIIENMYAPKGPYFIKNLNQNSIISEENVDFKLVNSSLVRIYYAGNKDGFIVIPMRLYPGWNAYVNDKKIHLDSYLNIMPVIKVLGNKIHNINFKYEPTYINFGIILMLFGFLFLIILYYLFTKIEIFRKQDTH